MTDQERILRRKAQGITAVVEGILKRDFDVKWFRPKVEDELRLLQLLQWRERYRVPVRWMLQQLVPFWRKKYSRYARHQGGLGVTIATLVGKTSEEILKERIREQFPDGENRHRWMAAEQQRQWARVWDGARKEDWEEPGKAILRYRQRVQTEREERTRWARGQKRRRYRDNPWLL